VRDGVRKGLEIPVGDLEIARALATNPKTPLAVALRQLPTLGERDLRMLAKSRNVPQTVVAQARRLLLATGRQA